MEAFIQDLLGWMANVVIQLQKTHNVYFNPLMYKHKMSRNELVYDVSMSI